jgi:16S rRNA (guanine527-N7)-methyltransferase
MSAGRRRELYEGDVVELVTRLREAEVGLRDRAVELLLGLARAIGRWNRVVNLISRKDTARLVSYHFADSASILPVLRPTSRKDVLDIGGSNGLPGLVLSALSPHVRLTIVDSRHRRQAFLEEVCQSLASDVRYEIDRVDSRPFRERYDGSFDLIIARAVTRLRLLLKWGMPLLKPAGCIVAYKGSRCVEEVERAQGYFFGHGGRAISVIESPWRQECNPLRLFAIALKSFDQEVGMWQG